MRYTYIHIQAHNWCLVLPLINSLSSLSFFTHELWYSNSNCLFTCFFLLFSPIIQINNISLIVINQVNVFGILIKTWQTLRQQAFFKLSFTDSTTVTGELWFFKLFFTIYIYLLYIHGSSELYYPRGAVWFTDRNEERITNGNKCTYQQIPTHIGVTELRLSGG